MPLQRKHWAIMAFILALFVCFVQSAKAQFLPVPIPTYQFFDSDGEPLAGGKLESFAAGTSTPAALYQDNVGTLHTNPVILDAGGRATIFFGPVSYKLVLKTSADVTIWTADNIPGAGQAVTSNAWSAITAATNANAGTFAASGNSWDWSAATSFKVPIAAGAVPTTSGFIAYDSTANKLVVGANGATRSFGLASTSACAANQWVSSPATATALAGCSQPAFSNISGQLNLATQTTGNLTTPRIITGGTSLVTGDFAIDANWGSGASVSAVTGKDAAFRVTVTAGTSPASPAALTLTFKDGTWTNAPIAVCSAGNVNATSSGATSREVYVSTTATTLVLTLQGTPIDSSAHIYNCQVTGL